MRLTATLDEAELRAILVELLPTEIRIGRPEKPRGHIKLEQPGEATITQGAGVRVSCRASVRIQTDLVPITMGTSRVQLALTPRIEESEEGHALVFDLRVEQPEGGGIRSFVERGAIDLLNRKIVDQGIVLRWKYGRTLTREFDVSWRLKGVRAIGMRTDAGQVSIGEQSLHLELPLSIDVYRSELQSNAHP